MTTAALQLPAELTIYTAAETRSAWLAWLADGAEGGGDHGDGAPLCRVDASGCDEIDAAGTQLLVALAHSLARRQCQLRLAHPSPSVQAACSELGLAGWLLDPDTQVAA